MKRREFITLFGATAAWPLSARAQQPTVPVIGFLHGGVAAAFQQQVSAYREGLRAAGFVEGQNVVIEYRWAEGHFERLPALADELIRAHAAVIAAIGGDVVAHAVMKETSEIPIVFMVGQDAIKSGLVSSLSRPAGNVTGVTLFVPLLVPKQMELIHMAAPKATVIGVLNNRNNSSVLPDASELEDAARANGMKLLLLNATTSEEIGAAIVMAANQGAGALLVPGDVFFTSHRDQILNLTAQHSLPTIYPFREYVAAGGLMSYGNILNDVAHLAATYTARILHGEKPGDLPVEQPTKFDMTVNQKTARSLGLTIPQSLLVAADEVFE
jgi:putative tryptophan/tyrosine transport system substrate-binding protein